MTLRFNIDGLTGKDLLDALLEYLGQGYSLDIPVMIMPYDDNFKDGLYLTEVKVCTFTADNKTWLLLIGDKAIDNG